MTIANLQSWRRQETKPNDDEDDYNRLEAVKRCLRNRHIRGKGRKLKAVATQKTLKGFQRVCRVSEAFTDSFVLPQMTQGN